MHTRIDQYLKSAAKLSTVLGSAFLLVGLVLSAVHLPVEAAGTPLDEPSGEDQSLVQACTPPGDWDLTTRVGASNASSKQWTFEVGEAEMDVILTVFYYQDYDKRGCPFDCAAGDCQTDETGRFETPFGNFEVTDGQEGAQGGTHKFEGTLPQGSYQVVFTATGGSINVGTRVLIAAVPTATPAPTLTPTAVEPTQTPTATPVDSITPTSTGTVLPTVNPPEPTSTPPRPELTTTPTSGPPTSLTPTLPPTLEPPPPPSNATPGAVLIPVTGADLTGGGYGSSFYIRFLLHAGIGLLGLGLVFHGVAARFNRSKKID